MASGLLLRSSKTLVATALGITFSAMFTGGGLALTNIALPALLLPAAGTPLLAPAPATKSTKPATTATHLARQWQTVFNAGMVMMGALAGTSALSFLYCLSIIPQTARTRQYYYIAAAVLAAMPGPFTWWVMKYTNSELHRRATRAEEEGIGDVTYPDLVEGMQGGVEGYKIEELVTWWGQLNLMRASLPAMAALCGTMALVQE